MLAQEPRSGGATDRDLVITRIIDAPRRLIFEAWTDPRHALQWLGPRDYPATHLEIDPRPGGRWRGCLTATADGRELWQHGTFHEVIPHERISFTFVWEEEGERGIETLVTLTFAEVEGRTRMVLHQRPFQSVSERDGHGGGWSSSFDRLADYLATQT